MMLLTTQGTYTIPLLAALRVGWVTALELPRQTAMVAGIVTLALVGGKLLPFLALPIPVGLLVLAATIPIARRRRRTGPPSNSVSGGT